MDDKEFALNFKNIERTETLSFPTFDEFVENNKQDIYGVDIKSHNDIFRLLYSYNNDIILENFSTGVNDFEKPLTKENYIEACWLCRKLFKGEE